MRCVIAKVQASLRQFLDLPTSPDCCLLMSHEFFLCYRQQNTSLLILMELPHRNSLFSRWIQCEVRTAYSEALLNLRIENNDFRPHKQHGRRNSIHVRKSRKVSDIEHISCYNINAKLSYLDKLNSFVILRINQLVLAFFWFWWRL